METALPFQENSTNQPKTRVNLTSAPWRQWQVLLPINHEYISTLYQFYIRVI